MFGIACGYADANDAARLAHDPVFKLLIGRDAIDGKDNELLKGTRYVWLKNANKLSKKQ